VRIFDRPSETMRPDLMEQVQIERLQALLARLKRNVRRYRDLLGDLKATSLADLARLPFTTPGDLLDAFPYGMFALPLREVIRLYSIVGPEGKPLVVGHTRNDLAQWARLSARQLIAAGVTSNDVVQIVFSGGFLPHASGYMLGAEMIGSSVTPEDPFHIEYQLEILQNYRTTVLVTTPTNALDLVDLLRSLHLDPQSLHLRTLILSRPIPDTVRQELETGLFTKVRAAFGLAEVLDPGLTVECEQGRLHVPEDHFLVEVCDGELVVTTLTREAMPLLRYRTRVACGLERGKCPCGRTGAWLVPGERLDGRIRVQEMPLYRAQIAAVLAKTRAAGQPFRLEFGERWLSLEIEVSEQFFADQMRVLANLRNEIRSEFFARLGIEADVRYVSQAEE